MAGNCSYEVFLRGHWTDTFNRIENLKFWMSTDFEGEGLTIKWKGEGVTAYTQPTTATSTIATEDIPTEDPGTANVSIGGALDGYLDDEGYSDFIVTQLQTKIKLVLLWVTIVEKLRKLQGTLENKFKTICRQTLSYLQKQEIQLNELQRL